MADSLSSPSRAFESSRTPSSLSRLRLKLREVFFRFSSLVLGECFAGDKFEEATGEFCERVDKKKEAASDGSDTEVNEVHRFSLSCGCQTLEQVTEKFSDTNPFAPKKKTCASN